MASLYQETFSKRQQACRIIAERRKDKEDDDEGGLLDWLSNTYRIKIKNH